MLIWTYGIFAIALLASELLYFRIADRYGIVDNPNKRSSHTGAVIRGGGIVFFMAMLGWFFLNGMAWPFLMAGITLVAVVSFLDDIKPQRAGVRFSVHLLAVTLLFYQTGVYHWPVWLVIMAAIVCIGTINAFNFMDGINGMTGVYALVSLLSFLYINAYVVPFADTQLMAVAVISVAVFLIFNFREKAKCFAGDVGSVTIAFLQIFLLLRLVQATGNYFWVIMFLVYGIDSSVTILYRLARRENIFHAHRTHLYQYLGNEWQWQHRTVSLLYGLAQAVLNMVLIGFLPQAFWVPLISASAFVVLYMGVRVYVTKRIHMR